MICCEGWSTQISPSKPMQKLLVFVELGNGISSTTDVMVVML
jgi:hypothetical protein